MIHFPFSLVSFFALFLLQHVEGGVAPLVHNREMELVLLLMALRWCVCARYFVPTRISQKKRHRGLIFPKTPQRLLYLLWEHPYYYVPLLFLRLICESDLGLGAIKTPRPLITILYSAAAVCARKSPSVTRRCFFMCAHQAMRIK